MAKTPNDVRGRKINCINFEMCPLCYGCRNSNSLDDECIKCKENTKINICKTSLHKTDLISKFIKKSEIEIKDKVTFKSK